MRSNFGHKEALATSAPPWIPEDDLLLKNAIEAGASLEALAKGAVRFSRKFNVQELQDRWRSLLYDPVVSAEASARMVELEQSTANVPSKFNRSGNSKESTEVPSKRTIESVRRMYYAMRKRACSRPSNSPSLDFLCSPDADDSKDHGSGFEEHVRPPNNSLLGGCMENQISFQEIGEDILDRGPQDISSKGIVRNEFPVKFPPLSAKEMIANENFEQTNEHGDSPHILGENLVQFGNSSDVERPGPSHSVPDGMNYSSPQPGLPPWKTEDISAPTMPTDTINENEDGKDAVDKSSYDSLNLLLLNSPNDVREDDAPDLKEPQALVSKTCPVTSDVACPAEMEVIVDHQSLSVYRDQHSIFCSEANVPSSTSAQNPRYPELHGGVVVCTLNSEDPEIPCNDDFLPGKACVSSLIQAIHKKAWGVASSSANRKDCEQELSLTKKEYNPTHIFGSDIVLQTSPNLPHVSDVVKPEVHGGKCLPVLSRQANIAIEDSSQCRSVHGFPYSTTNGLLKKDPLNACNSTNMSLHTKASSIANTVPEPAANPSAIDQEENESEDDVPCFADVEAMILEMDLCPDDSDSCISREVARYQHEDTKRTIIRLEQSARSSMQRAIASKGAFAILYGHHLKHYISKAEVILGRATNDFDVDIDLGREGRANKISRRQALLKMEENGSFSLKNLGKSSIFLDGKEIASGQIVTLTSCSLIEIRGMSFVFELNQKSVRQYMMNVAKKKQENNPDFEWSEEKVS